MKKMMILASAIMMAAAANAKNDESVTASFNEVRVNVPARVRVVAGEDYSVNVSAQNEYVAKSIRYTVKGGVLYLSSYDVDSLVDSNEAIHITIVAPKDVKLTTGRDMQTVNVLKSINDKEDVAKN